jgi:aminoglycoside 3-N-acetyltransferase I
MSFVLRRLGPTDLAAMRALNALFGETFEDPGSYQAQPPSDGYLTNRLARPDIIVLCAFDGETVIGGLVAYVLDKLEQARAEVYIYDLAVDEAWRRQGVATALIEALKPIAREASAWVIYVQADYEDPPAVAFYDKLGRREEVLHFDIAVDAP